MAAIGSRVAPRARASSRGSQGPAAILLFMRNSKLTIQKKLSRTESYREGAIHSLVLNLIDFDAPFAAPYNAPPAAPPGPTSESLTAPAIAVDPYALHVVLRAREVTVVIDVDPCFASMHFHFFLDCMFIPASGLRVVPISPGIRVCHQP